MTTLLFQVDGSLPNLALMVISQHVRQCGDEPHLVKIRNAMDVERRLGENYSKVYASAIFEKSMPIVNRIRQVYPHAVIGGTGVDARTTLESLGIVGSPDYSIYPQYLRSIGFTQRGCRLSCPFCVVPSKEGKVKSAFSIAEIWRGAPHPKDIVLLDNDFFGNPLWRERITEIREGKYRVNFNQGINARLLPEEGAEAIAGIDYFDADFSVRRIYTAWDNKKDEQVLFRGLNRLVKAGIPASRIMVYMLIGYWAGETEDDWVYRQNKLREFGCDPYPMPFHRTQLTVGFQRWVVGHYDRKISWKEWRDANCDPRQLKSRGKMALPLFDSAGAADSFGG